MAITNGYLSRADLKLALAIGTADSVDNEIIDDIANAVSRMIDDYTGQFFYQITGGTAFYTSADGAFVPTDPFTSITQLASDNDGNGTFSQIWTTADYILAPYNAALFSQPYRGIQTSPNSNLGFPYIPRGCRLIGNLGWSSVPDAVHQAAIIQGTAVYEARKAPFGIVGSTEQGTVLRMSNRLHPEAQLLLDPYRLHLGMGV